MLAELADDVPLIEAFRLIDDVEAVAGAILRATVASDPRYWIFPSLEELLPELRELAWHRMLAGTLLVVACRVAAADTRLGAVTAHPRREG